MKKIYLILVLFCFLYSNAIADDLSINQEQNIKDFLQIVHQFKNAIATDDSKIVADYVRYPLERMNPIPNIDNKDNFIARYDSLIDDNLKKIIINSKDEAWESVGWRGIMLYAGLLWLDYDGKLIAINRLSPKEKEYINEWIQKDKDSIHPKLKDFLKNILVFQTNTYLGRIDEIKKNDDFQYSYRLALWHKDAKMSEKPIILIDNGTMEYFGTAHNHTYRFSDNRKIYAFDVTYVGPRDMVPYQLIISEDNKEISSESAVIIK